MIIYAIKILSINTTCPYLDVAVEPGSGVGHLQAVVGRIASVVIAPIILYITKAIHV